MTEQVLSDPWANQFLGFSQDQRFAVVIVAIGCLTGIILTLAGISAALISKANQRRIEAELKRDMLDRGMSAEELSRVIEATTPDETTSYLNAIFGRKK